MFFRIFLNTKNLENSEDTDHDKSIFITMMGIHEFSDFSTKVCHEYEKHKYRYHERFSIFFCPVGEGRMIWLQIFCLKNCKTTNNKYKKECKYTWFWNTEDCRLDYFCESFLEHFECCEEDNEESDPLDRWIFFEEFRYPARCYDHEDNRDDESNNEVHDISMTRSRYGEDIVEWHSDISDDNCLDCFHEAVSSFLSFFLMLMGSNLSVEFPYDIEKEYCSEEFQSRNFHKKNDPKRKNNTKDRCPRHSPEYCLFSLSSLELLGCHTYKNGIIATHDEVDEDDIEESKCSCTREYMSKISRESIKHREWNEK